MSKASGTENGKQQNLFVEPLPNAPRPQLRSLEYPIWTENKAKLIERYLFLFLMVTKHGSYIDGFAGPQKPNELGMWAAKLVLDLKPQWLRHFYLFEKNKKLCDQLHKLEQAHPDLAIEIFEGDFNKRLSELLSKAVITQKEATFCLLDQRTFECHWSTVKSLADYKTNGHKIELFYFLPHFWLDRALAAQKKTDVLNRWWGGDGWAEWRKMEAGERKEYFVSRFTKELGYRYALAWPVFRRKHGGRIMYHMIHASDHDEAPNLMYRAYDRALDPGEPEEQFELNL